MSVELKLNKMPEDAKNSGAVWEYLFKINQLLLPLVIVWAAWATSSIYELKGFANTGPRFTTTDATSLELQIKEWVRMNYPPDELYAEIKEIKVQSEATHREIEEIKIILAKQDILD